MPLVIGAKLRCGGVGADGLRKSSFATAQLFLFPIHDEVVGSLVLPLGLVLLAGATHAAHTGHAAESGLTRSGTESACSRGVSTARHSGDAPARSARLGAARTVVRAIGADTGSRSASAVSRGIGGIKP